jgi:hypothetical protein
MKKYLLFISAFCALPLLSVAQNDVYYIPSKNVNEVTVRDRQVSANEDEEEPNYVVHHNNSRDIDEYNRRGSYNSKSSDGDSIDPNLQNQEDDDNDYASTKMIVRFHAPVANIIVSSPYYWDICYGNTWDTYYDDWAFGLPSWSFWSYAYDPWSYNRWWYRTCWDYTWGWYDPWWGSNYWGWGRPLYWGWDRPYYGRWGSYTHFDGWGGHGGFVPGFDHIAGGGRQMMANTSSITRGSAGGFIRQGGSNYRSMYTNSQSGNQNYSTLSKSFRMNGLDGRSNNSAIRSGGGFSRSNSNYYSRSNSSYQNQNNRSSYNSTPSRTTTVQQNSVPSSRSYNSGSSSSGRSGGFSSGGGGGSRSGGGGFSRGGGGRR